MRGAEFEARIEVDGDHALLYATGEFDMHGLPLFEQALGKALLAEAISLTVDLSGVTFISSSGLAGLVLAERRFEDVVLHGVAPNVLRVIDMGGLGGWFTID